MENTQGDCGGRVMPSAWLDRLRSICRHRRPGLWSHLDGSRLLNASVACGLPPSRLADGFDSVSVCMSKGVGAPAGAVLAGEEEFVRKARRARKAIGGGGTQVGGCPIRMCTGLPGLKILN